METDPTAFYSYEEYETAAQMLYKTVKLRAESIAGQLDGTIPSTDDGQRADSAALIDASHIDVTAMGQFSMGGFGGQNSRTEADSASSDESTAPADTSAERASPDSVDDRTPQSDTQTEADDTSATETDRQKPSFSGMPDRPSGQSGNTKNLVTFGICLAVMLAALLLIKLFMRKK